MSAIVGCSVAAAIAMEHARHRPRAVAVVVQRCAADPRDLEDHAGVSELPWPPRLLEIGGAEAKVPKRRVVGAILQVTPFLAGVGEARPRLQYQNVQPARGQLLGNHRATAPSPNDDHVTHHELACVRPR